MAGRTPRGYVTPSQISDRSIASTLRSIALSVPGTSDIVPTRSFEVPRKCVTLKEPSLITNTESHALSRLLDDSESARPAIHVPSNAFNDALASPRAVCATTRQRTQHSSVTPYRRVIRCLPFGLTIRTAAERRDND